MRFRFYSTRSSNWHSNAPPKKDWFLVNGSLTLSTHDEQSQAIVSAALKEFTPFFERQNKLGQRRRQIQATMATMATMATRRLHRAMLILVVAMRVMGRSGFDKAASQQVAEQALRLVSCVCQINARLLGVLTMNGQTDLQTLLQNMKPELQAGEFVFCTMNAAVAAKLRISPIGQFLEDEGLTLILTRFATGQKFLQASHTTSIHERF